jgi:manganese oxidase
MKRRDFLLASGSVLPALAITRAMADSDHVHHNQGEPAAGRRDPQGYMPVHTPNGWTLPYRLVDGVKEFHLVAEEIEHEFAPGPKPSAGVITAPARGQPWRRWRATGSGFM